MIDTYPSAGFVAAATEPSDVTSREYHPFDPEVITQLVGSGDKGIRISFYDGAGGDGYLGQITWRNPIMPQLGVYLQFMTGKGTKKWVPASKSLDLIFIKTKRNTVFTTPLICDKYITYNILK